MSVIVATAYMDEAERFDWLVAMNAGKVLDTGTPAEIREKTGEPTLEKAFIKLLPEEATARPQGAGASRRTRRAATCRRSSRTG